MFAQVSSHNQCSNCCATAAACTCARISLVLDTALLLVVSIFLCLITLPQ